MAEVTSKLIPPIRLRLNRSRQENRQSAMHLRKQTSLVGLLQAQDLSRNNPRYLLHFKRLFSEQEQKIKALSIQLQAKDARLQRIERMLKLRTERGHPYHHSELAPPLAESETHLIINPPKKASQRIYESGYNLLRKQELEPELQPEQPELRNSSTRHMLQSPLNMHRDDSERRIRIPIDRLRRISRAELLRRVKEASESP